MSLNGAIDPPSRRSAARLGIFGGTFDPPHVGHLILAAEAYEQLRLDRLLWVLTPAPPHKHDQPLTPWQHRLEMVEAAIADRPEYELSRVDIDRPPPHYALDSVNLLRQQNPACELIYIIGGDSLRDLPTWHRPLELIAACDALGVMRRPGDKIHLETLERQLPGLTAKVRFIEAPLLDIASSEIRSRVVQQRPFRDYLPAAVYQIIQKRGLYRQPAGCSAAPGES